MMFDTDATATPADFASCFGCAQTALKAYPPDTAPRAGNSYLCYHCSLDALLVRRYLEAEGVTPDEVEATMRAASFAAPNDPWTEPPSSPPALCSSLVDPWSAEAQEPCSCEQHTELLAEYAGKPVKRFRQFDCFIDVEVGDPIVTPDADGHCVFHGFTNELRNSGPGLVRVSIHESTSRSDAVAAIRKMADQLAGGFWPEDDTLPSGTSDGPPRSVPF